MNEQEREIVIKEARIAALHDIEAALRKLTQENLVSNEVKEAAKFISHYIGQRVSDVAQDKADRQRLSHTPWGHQYEEERRLGASRC
jgi:SepF-like predicted cell division protein (DUF552 family)